MKRIHELAKEQGVDAHAIVEVLKAAGLPASKCTPSSTISDDWERRLLPLCSRLRDAEKKKHDKELKALAVAAATHSKTKAAKTPAAAAPGKAGAAHAGAGGAKAKSTAATAGRKPSAPQPKRYTDEASAAPAAHAAELDAWVEAGPKEKKPTKREQREAAKKQREAASPPMISGEEVSALDDFPKAAVPQARSLTDAEIIRAAGLEVPPAADALPVPAARPEPSPAPAAAAPAAPAKEKPQRDVGLKRWTEETAPTRKAVFGSGIAPIVAPAAAAAPQAPAPPRKTDAELRAERRAERDRLEREKEAYLRAERERVEKERSERERGDRERVEKERAERERGEKEKTDRERARREQREREQREQREKDISPAAAALAAAFEAKKRAGAAGAASPAASADDAEDEKLIGDVLLGEIPEEDEEIGAAVGAVPEGPTKKGPVPITRRDKQAVQPAGRGPGGGSVKAGFKQGGGFTVERRDRSGSFMPAYSSGAGRGGPGGPGRPGGKQFFKIAGGGGRTSTLAPQQKFERPTKVTLTPPFTIKELSVAMGVKVPEIIGKMMKKGKMFTMNTPLTEELASEIALEFNVEVEVAKRKEAEDELAKLAAEHQDAPDALKARAPVITILGHVDHGKTSLLDRIRKSNVAGGEAGGITQHIGAYKVHLPDGKAVVFVDTPGHEAFTEMRARGANVTDVVVLVVAADDGVMPQTEEAYNHAKAANVPVVVALNKIDKPSANPMRVKTQLASMGLQPVDWGGTTEVIEVSALNGKGIDTLLETLALQSDILELKANPDKLAAGTCLEARISEGRGVVAHLLVQEGTLRRGDMIVCGSGYGRVRALFDDSGQQMADAPPATPVEVIGLEEIPEAGARFYVLDDMAKAKEIAADRLQRKRQAALAERTHITLDNIFERMKAGKAKEVRIVLKGDVRGSIEVLAKEIPALSTDEVKVKLLHSGVGGVTESDVLLADASEAIVIGFNVVADEKAKTAAELKGVDVRTYRIIYQITDDIKKAMEGLLAPEEREVVLGQVEVRKIFHASQIGTIAGCYVKSGKVERTGRARLIRDGVIKFEGDIASLKRLKDDAKEVREGLECGITLKGYNDINEGDRIEAFTIEKVARTL